MNEKLKGFYLEICGDIDYELLVIYLNFQNAQFGTLSCDYGIDNAKIALQYRYESKTIWTLHYHTFFNLLKEAYDYLHRDQKSPLIRQIQVMIDPGSCESYSLKAQDPIVNLLWGDQRFSRLLGHQDIRQITIEIFDKDGTTIIWSFNFKDFFDLLQRGFKALKEENCLE